MSLNGYFKLHKLFFAHLPLRSQVKIDEEIWYAKQHTDNSVLLENIVNGTDLDANYLTKTLLYEDDDIIWKLYEPRAIIELRLIQNSLAEKAECLRSLVESVEALTARVKTLEDAV
jgi:hypothetical protein